MSEEENFDFPNTVFKNRSKYCPKYCSNSVQKSKCNETNYQMMVLNAFMHQRVRECSYLNCVKMFSTEN